MRKVFGIGFNKTGTSTLGACLRQLDYRHVSYRSDLLHAMKCGDMGRIIAETRKYDSFEDWPWPLVYRQLYAAYGDDARYVLTVRATPDIWIESLKRHALTTDPDRPMRIDAYGYKYPHGYEREHIALYLKHNAEVRRFFSDKPERQFLEVCWEAGDGWDRLCGFLGHPVPAAPFPHIRPNSEGVPAHIKAANAANIARQLQELRGSASGPVQTRR